ncbi:MAG TPA: hypothetical protein VGC79_32350 [Polyangiaceae bacterium]
MKSIVTAARPEPPIAGKVTKTHLDYAELEAAVDYLDADATRWTAFVDSVGWRFNEGTAREQMKKFEEALVLDERTNALPSEMVAERLVLRVLETSAEGEMSLRVLTRTGLNEIAGTSASELEVWRNRVKADRLLLWIDEADRRLEQLEATAAVHGCQLEDHEDRIQKTESAPRARILAQSARGTRYLAQFATLNANAGGSGVHVNREVVGALADAALEGSLVVVGEPGAGKSGVLSALVCELQSRAKDVLVLSAEGAHDLGDTLVDVVEEWNGDGAGVLIVDALDSLRDDGRAEALRKRLGDIIRSGGRWSVVASIRTFDLYQGTAASRLFAGSPPTRFKDSRFFNVRHVAIGAFTDAELRQLEVTAPLLFDLATKAPTKLGALLRNPFNLSLASEVLADGAQPEDFAGVQSQVDLLDLYWRSRVGVNASTKDAKEAVVREICDRMLKQRRLQAGKAGLDPDRLYDLLTADVIREPDHGGSRQDDAVVAFSHHIVFDFSVAKLWLPTEHEALAELLISDPELLIVARPSLEMAIHRSWRADANRKPFWKAVLRMCGDNRMRAVGKIIGPALATVESTVWADVEPLGEALRSADAAIAAAADAALGYLVGALLAGSRGAHPIAGNGAGPWVELAEFTSSLDRSTPINCARRLLVALTENPLTLTSEQMRAAGRAARSLFAMASRGDGSYRLLFPDAIRFVCRTFSSDGPASSALIRSLLGPEVIKQHGYVLMPPLAREVTPLFADPALAEAVYVAAFGTPEESREVTNFGGGIVMGFSSTRRQDYESGLYSLKEEFRHFLASSIKHATRALVIVLESHAAREHAPVSGVNIEGTFAVGCEIGVIRTDYSSSWESREHVDELEMLDAWEGRVATLAADSANANVVESLFKLCVLENRLAIFWRRWLRLASRETTAEVTGPIVLPLLESSHVLTAVDTAQPAGEALRVQFARRTVDERVRIERAILATRSLWQDTERADLECSRLFGCIDTALLATNECRELAEDLRVRGIARANVRPFSRAGWRQTPEDTSPHAWLRRAGVPVDEQPHKRVLDEATSLAQARDAANDVAKVEALLDNAERLVEMLEQLGNEVHGRVVDSAWGEVAEALAKVARAESSIEDPAVRERIWRIAATVVECPSPRATPGGDRQMHETPSWSEPHARGTVAEVLVTIACAEPSAAVLDALECLCDDDVASVRYRAISRLGYLARVAPDTVWRVAKRMVAEESIRGVLAALAARTIPALAAMDAIRAARLVGCLLNRVVDGTGAKEVRSMAYSLLCDLYIDSEGGRVASSLVCECILRPESADAETLLHRIRNDLSSGPLDLGNTDAARQRGRAQQVVACIVDRAIADFSEFRSTYPGEIPKDAIPHGRALVVRLETAAKEVYFGSGKFDDSNAQPQKTRRDPQVTARFFEELAPTLERLASTGMPSVAHAVIETLEYLLAMNPKRGFLMVGLAVESAKPNGYQFDSLAAGLIVKVCTRFLAEHRALLQEDPAVRDALLNILDVFVVVGWPEAQEITYGLHDIFR